MTARARKKMFGLLAIVTLSSATMLWMFWHYPVGTAIATVAVLTAFGVLVRLARAIETDHGELDSGKQGA
jgi:hypothetical protein